MVLEFMKSQKGKDLLISEGHLFETDKRTNDGRVFWKCREAKKGKCPARLHTLDNEIIKVLRDHNHIADVAAIQARKALVSMKERAKTTRDATYAVVAEASSGLLHAAQAKLPTVECMKRTVRRQREVQGNFPPNPHTLRELNIPPEMSTINVNGQEEQFLLYDNGDEERVLIFSTRRNLDLLSRSSHWYADGTFKTTPPLFQQVYTIHGVHFNNCIPSVFALLPGKSKAVYQRFLGALKNFKDGLQPTSVMMDFERGAIDAFETEFPGVSVRGCLFHMGQCLWRKVQETGKAVRYSNDAEFAVQVKMLTALAFLPVQDVVAGFEDLLESDYYRNEEDIEPISYYFEDVWIERTGRRQRRPPLFAHSLWNCNQAVQEDLPRTNNTVEGWHRRFGVLVAAEHPTIWKFIDNLRKEQHMNNIAIEQYIQGGNPPPQKKIYRDVNTRLKNCVLRYDAADKIAYLREIAYNLNLNV